MPQITLKLSKNIAADQIDFQPLFVSVHQELEKSAGVDIKACNSGVIQESYSCIGLGDEKVTKVYLEILWIENEERLSAKNRIIQAIMDTVQAKLVPQIVKQGLICVPRVRIGDLGVLGREYLIGKVN